MAHATPEQRDNVVSIITAAALRAFEAKGLSEEGAARVLASKGEFALTVEKAVGEALQSLSITQEFADEEVESGYGYLSGYTPTPVADQLVVLRQLFPELGTVDESLASGAVPEGAEGNFAFPRWERIAPTYGEAVEKVLELLTRTRDGNVVNYRTGELGPTYLRQSAKKEAAFRKLGDEQKGHDFLVVAAQFGLRHRGRSVRRARAVMETREFGLGAFEIGIMLLTHPNRLQHYDDLWIDCGGDEYSYEASGSFEFAPFFSVFHDGQLKFGAGDVDVADDSGGSTSGFAPQ